MTVACPQCDSEDYTLYMGVSGGRMVEVFKCETCGFQGIIRAEEVEP